jgi:hypothetical protein
MASLLTGVYPQCFYAHRRVTAPYVTKCYSFGILAPWAVDCKCRKKFLQFFTFSAVTVNSEKFKQRIAELQARFKVTDAKTQELLENLRETIKTVESINFKD